MRILDLLPFAAHARLANSRYEKAMVSDLVFPKHLSLPNGLTQEDAIEYFITRRRVVPVFQMNDDLSVRVADLSGIEYRFLAALPPEATVTLKVQEKDYQDVLANLRFDEQGGAYYDVVGVSDYEPLDGGYSEAIHQASMGDYLALLDLIRLGKSEPIEPEAIQEGRLKPGTGQKIQRLSVDKVERLVTNYITSRNNSSRVPVLIGNTAVAKSALVKNVVRSLGLRLVDFRCAFLDKMDIEGFRNKYQDPDTGELLSTTSPPEKLLECTDEFIKYARATAEELKRKLQTMEDPQEIAATRRVLARLEEKGKAPVLFFDEVTRATSSVQNAFVQILNQKKYRGMKFEIARIIAATNYPVDMNTRSLDFEDAYLTTEIEDAGIVERYEPVIVRHQDVAPRWFEFIEGKGNFDPAVTDFLKKNKKYAYYIKYVSDLVKAGMPSERSSVEANPLVTGTDDVGIIPFPNFRTWEFVSDHVKAVRLGKTYFNVVLVEGYLGKNEASEKFIEAVRAEVPEAAEEPPGDDFLSESLEASFQSGTPALLLGMTSIGKTSRINMMAKKIGARVVTINLAQMDRVDVQGAPAALSVAETFTSAARGNLPPDVSALLDKNVSEMLPASPNLTRMLPDFYLNESIKAARAANQKVVLFFDEINRADKNTLSAVLEAVSDQKFGGVSFPWLCGDPTHLDQDGNRWAAPRDDLVQGKCPRGHTCEPQVIIAAAANYGGQYSEAGKMDPAISGRFSMITKTEFDPSDKKAILDFMRAPSARFPNGYPEVLISFIESKPLDDLKEMLSTVESRSIVEAAPSLRAWSDVAKMLGQVEDPALLGELPDEQWERDLERGFDTLDEVEKRVWSIPDNWAGLLGDQQVTVGSEVFSVPEFVQEVRDAVTDIKRGQEANWFGQAKLSPSDVQAAIKDMNRYLVELARVNSEVREYREQEFISKFGKRYTKEFLPFYNTNMGKTFLDIKDVVSEKLVWRYGEQVLSATDNPNEKRDALLAYMETFYDTFGESASPSLYTSILLFAKERVPAKDMLLDILILYTKDGFPLVRGFLNKALNPDVTMDLASHLYLVTLKKADVDAYYQAGLAPKGTDGHPPVIAGGTPS